MAIQVSDAVAPGSVKDVPCARVTAVLPRTVTIGGVKSLTVSVAT